MTELFSFLPLWNFQSQDPGDTSGLTCQAVCLGTGGHPDLDPPGVINVNLVKMPKGRRTGLVPSAHLSPVFWSSYTETALLTSKCSKVGLKYNKQTEQRRKEVKEPGMEKVEDGGAFGGKNIWRQSPAKDPTPRSLEIGGRLSLQAFQSGRRKLRSKRGSCRIHGKYYSFSGQINFFGSA